MPVLKSDKKSVRIYGDFTVTVNQVSRVDSYLLPKPEDLLARLAGGKMFSMLDLSQAYCRLNWTKIPESLLLSTLTKAYFQFTRLPYGVSSAPGILQ